MLAGHMHLTSSSPLLYAESINSIPSSCLFKCVMMTTPNRNIIFINKYSAIIKIHINGDGGWWLVSLFCINNKNNNHYVVTSYHVDPLMKLSIVVPYFFWRESAFHMLLHSTCSHRQYGWQKCTVRIDDAAAAVASSIDARDEPRDP